jgi:hypothetical protein
MKFIKLSLTLVFSGNDEPLFYNPLLSAPDRLPKIWFARSVPVDILDCTKDMDAFADDCLRRDEQAFYAQCTCGLETFPNNFVMPNRAKHCANVLSRCFEMPSFMAPSCIGVVPSHDKDDV